jgi:hypothetical protein
MKCPICKSYNLTVGSKNGNFLYCLDCEHISVIVTHYGLFPPKPFHRGKRYPGGATLRFDSSLVVKMSQQA